MPSVAVIRKFRIAELRSSVYLGYSQNQHAISIGEEAVFLFHGFGVGFEDDVLVCESRNEHDEGALREVKIC